MNSYSSFLQRRLRGCLIATTCILLAAGKALSRPLKGVDVEATLSFSTQSNEGGGTTPMVYKKRFNEDLLDDFLEARDLSVRLVALYQQVCTARSDADKEQTPHSEALETKLVNAYLKLAEDVSKRMKKLEGKVPFDLLKEVLAKLPEEVAKDLLQLA